MKLYEINHLESREIPNMIQIINNHFDYLHNYSDIVHNTNEITNLLHSNEMIGLLLYDDAPTLAGYLFGKFMNLNDGRYVFCIYYFYVYPLYRRNKYGYQILDTLLKSIQNNYGVNYVMLACVRTNISAIKLYQKFNFIEDSILSNSHDTIVLIRYSE